MSQRAGTPSPTDAMSKGKEAAMPLMRGLMVEAGLSDDPALMWAGAISLLCGGMAAHVGADVMRDAVRYLADNMHDAIDRAIRSAAPGTE